MKPDETSAEASSGASGRLAEIEDAKTLAGLLLYRATSA